MQLQPGTYLQGDKYRIIRCLGNGGFGITYLAEHELAGRNVCIKEFFPIEFYNRDEDSRSISLGSKGSADIMEAYKVKFMKEARTIARLDHPDIIHIFDVFAENNTAYYVMEYIDGASLNDLVKRGGALPEAAVVKYIRAVADALDYIHERKIMHLDIKPANIMVRKEDNRVILIDFGLSKQYDAEGNQTSSTPVGISHGYAPMEQYKKGGVSEFSPETDIYSLGATLYYLVTGMVPPQAADIADDGMPALPTHLTNGVRNAIERSMEVQRRRRPHSIKEFLALLDDKAVVAPIQTPAPTPESEATMIGVQAVEANEETVISTPKAAETKVEAPKAEQPKKEEKKKKKSKWWLWLLLALLVVGAGGYLALSGDKANTDGRKNTDSLHLPRKYADFLHLPHQLQGHFDFEEAVEDAKAQNKPIFVYVVGHACNNCREMETKVWSNDLVLTKLKEEFVICALYVDDKTEVKGGKRLGSINSKLAHDKWDVNAQPAYIILSPDGETVLAGPRGYDTNIKAFVEFLDKGKNAATVEITYDEGRFRNIEWNITVEPKGKNLYEVTFDGTIKEGFHCYAMKDFSAPMFEFENAEVVGDVVEPLTAEEHPDGVGGTSFCYYGKATYIYTIKAEAGTEVTGFVMATICSEDNMCTCNAAEFVIRL